MQNIYRRGYNYDSHTYFRPVAADLRELSSSILLISSHFEHHGNVSVARAQYICIGHGPRSRFRGVRSEMKSIVASVTYLL